MTKPKSVLDAFLGANTNIQREVPIKRLGVNVVVKALFQADIDKARAEVTFGAKVREELIEAAIIAKACVEPNFADPALISHYGAADPIDCVRKSLLSGEITLISQAISEISGFGDSAPELDFPN